MITPAFTKNTASEATDDILSENVWKALVSLVTVVVFIRKPFEKSSLMWLILRQSVT